MIAPATSEGAGSARRDGAFGPYASGATEGTTLAEEQPSRATGRATLVTGLSIAAIAVASGIEVSVFLRRFGIDARTDGVMSAFAVYTLIVVFAQILRTSAVPLIADRSARVHRSVLPWALLVLAVLPAGLCLAAAEPLGSLVASGTEASGQALAGTSLRILALAMALQVLSGGVAITGALRGQMTLVGRSYIVSAALGLLVFLVLLPVARELALPWAMVAAAATVLALLVRSFGLSLKGRPGLRTVAVASWRLTASTLLPVTFVAMYPITVALIRDTTPGEITLFALAFTLVSYLPGFTGVAIGMNDVIDLAGSRSRPQASAKIRRSFRLSMLISAPALVALGVVGQTVLDLLVPDSLSTSGSFRVLALDLAPWLLATLLLWATMPAFLARLGGRSVTRWVAPLVALDVVASLIGRAWAGLDGLVLAMCVAPAAFAVIALLVTSGSGIFVPLTVDGLVLALLTACAFGLAGLVVIGAAGDRPAAQIGAVALGSFLYTAAIVIAYRDDVRRLLARSEMPRNDDAHD